MSLDTIDFVIAKQTCYFLTYLSSYIGKRWKWTFRSSCLPIKVFHITNTATTALYERHVYSYTVFVFHICNAYLRHIQIKRFSSHTGILNNLPTVYIHIGYETAINIMCSTIMIHIFGYTNGFGHLPVQ